MHKAFWDISDRLLLDQCWDQVLAVVVMSLWLHPHSSSIFVFVLLFASVSCNDSCFAWQPLEDAAAQAILQLQLAFGVQLLAKEEVWCPWLHAYLVFFLLMWNLASLFCHYLKIWNELENDAHTIWKLRFFSIQLWTKWKIDISFIQMLSRVGPTLQMAISQNWSPQCFGSFDVASLRWSDHFSLNLSNWPQFHHWAHNPFSVVSFQFTVTNICLSNKMRYWCCIAAKFCDVFILNMMILQQPASVPFLLNACIDSYWCSAK